MHPQHQSCQQAIRIQPTTSAMCQNSEGGAVGKTSTSEDTLVPCEQQERTSWSASSSNNSLQVIKQSRRLRYYYGTALYSYLSSLSSPLALQVARMDLCRLGRENSLRAPYIAKVYHHGCYRVFCDKKVKIQKIWDSCSYSTSSRRLCGPSPRSGVDNNNSISRLLQSRSINSTSLSCSPPPHCGY